MVLWAQGLTEWLDSGYTQKIEAYITFSSRLLLKYETRESRMAPRFLT